VTEVAIGQAVAEVAIGREAAEVATGREAAQVDRAADPALVAVEAGEDRVVRRDVASATFLAAKSAPFAWTR